MPHPTQLRAALGFDARRMSPSEAEAYLRFRLCAVLSNPNPNPYPHPNPNPNPNPNPKPT